MRPMVFEYMDDPACSYLDMQYMLGGSLLVAPVFNEKGVSDYYIPGGTWTHLLTDEKREGGRFYRDTYDYFSMPLYVRPNTLLVRGNTDNRPDYDYTKDIKVHIYELEDGAAASCDLVNVKGEQVNRISAVRNGNVIKVTTDKEIQGVEYVLHMSEPNVKVAD